MESDIPSSSTNLNDASLVLEPDIANEIECADSETSAPDSDNASLCSLDLVEPPDTSSNNILPDHQKPFDHVSRLLKGKEKEWAAVLEKKSPLNLLDLPIDILKEIIKEVTHTNDLTSLALTHSALHSLAIPYIYSRFDIVWPDSHNSSEPRTGVDALTYGLATLVMSEEVFGESALGCQDDSHSFTCTHCGRPNGPESAAKKEENRVKRRRGNPFSKYTRKFSLGNGPPEWVQEYLIVKEGGKMLGTLVALAVAGMPNLETFIWDMPTGILRDVWSALSSLGDRNDGRKPRLERLWIRWHNNKIVTDPSNTGQSNAASQPTVPLIPVADLTSSNHNQTANPTVSNTNTVTTLIEQSYQRIEHPNFSILPPLKSLTVLEIDEPAYLIEMSKLIERSVDRLRELRVGTAGLWFGTYWSLGMQNDTSQPSTDNSSPDYINSGGVLGMIMSKLYDHSPQSQVVPTAARDGSVQAKQSSAISSNQNATKSEQQPNLRQLDIPSPVDALHPAHDTSHPKAEASSSISKNDSSCDSDHPSEAAAEPKDSDCVDGHITPSTVSHDGKEAQKDPILAQASSDSATPSAPTLSPTQQIQSEVPKTTSTNNAAPTTSEIKYVRYPQTTQKKLRLELLELEKVPLSVPVLQKTIDWSILTSLTLLHCEGDEELWKALRWTYSPWSNPAGTSLDSKPTSSRVAKLTHRQTSQVVVSPNPSSYRLKLKRIHTDTVSTALLTFLKETLAPNSLEWMFLQVRDSPASKVMVTTDSIYRGPLRRHRASLKKVMIDSGNRKMDNSSRAPRWKKWMLNREILTFMTSGKMSSLRELAIAVDYKDWHFFLQRLPQIPHLRSLYVPHIADYVYSQTDARELALQVVDIVALRPEIELCYLGISSKCFEILENRQYDDLMFAYHDSSTSPANAGPGGVVGDPDDDSDVDDDDHDDDDDDDDDDVGGNPDSDETQSDIGDDSDLSSEDDEGSKSEDRKKRPRLRLREILFYDDKVSIFKARHGQL